MRKMVASLSVLFFIISLCACTLSSEPETTIKIGYLAMNTSGPVYLNRNRIVQAAGGTLITEPLDNSFQGTLSGINRLIDAGCNGIIFTPMSESILSHITEICEEAGVYWVISMRPIHDPEIRQIVEASPFYAGTVMENDEETGYELMKELHSIGKYKVALLSTAKVDPVGEARERGIYKAADKFDMEIVAEIRNPATDNDVYNAISDIINAYPDLDAVFRVGTVVNNTTQAVIRAIEESSRSDAIKYVSIDLDGDMSEYFDNGIMIAAAGGANMLDSSIAAAILINAINGTPISDNGPPTFIINYLQIKSSEDLIKYNEYINTDNGILFAEDEARQMLLKNFNPDLDETSYVNIIQNCMSDIMN